MSCQEKLYFLGLVFLAATATAIEITRIPIRAVHGWNSGIEGEGAKIVEEVGVGFGVEVDEGCFVIAKLIVSDLAKSPHPSQA